MTDRRGLRFAGLLRARSRSAGFGTAGKMSNAPAEAVPPQSTESPRLNRPLPPFDLIAAADRRDQSLMRTAGRLVRDAASIAHDDAASALAIALTVTLDRAGIDRSDATRLLTGAALVLAERASPG